MEGDATVCATFRRGRIFLSTPSGWRATKICRGQQNRDPISIHALRVEGDIPKAGGRLPPGHFYPRPPGGGRPLTAVILSRPAAISIHALRVEGDTFRSQRRGREPKFLSTPSGWRATRDQMIGEIEQEFLSTPSGWRATRRIFLWQKTSRSISIHALRVEGDSKNGQSFRLFLRKREKNLPL